MNLENKTQHNESYICKTLNRTDSHVDLKLSDDDKLLICSNILENSYPNCTKHKICFENETCLCPWGHREAFCNQSKYYFLFKYYFF